MINKRDIHLLFPETVADEVDKAIVRRKKATQRELNRTEWFIEAAVEKMSREDELY